MERNDDLKSAAHDRRAFLGTFGKAAVVAPPVITAMLSTSMASPAIAASTGGSAGPKGNNGLGNGEDPQPPGNPPINDGLGSSPGNPHGGAASVRAHHNNGGGHSNAQSSVAATTSVRHNNSGRHGH